MSEAPRLTSNEISAIAIVFVVLAVLYGLLWIASRWVISTVAKAEAGSFRSRLLWMQEHFGWLVLVYSVGVLIALPALFYIVYEDRLLEGILASVALLWFLRTQLPSLISPAVSAVFHHWDEDQNRYVQSASETDRLHPGSETFLHFRLLNTSLATYEACACSITLPRSFEILPWDGDALDSKYLSTDYAKPFSFQRQNNCARFAPEPTHTLHPGDSVWYPVLVRSPQTEDQFNAKIEFSTKSCWSSTVLSKNVLVGVPSDR